MFKSLWQLSGRGEGVNKLLRTIVVRLARAMGGGVDYWLSLPIGEMLAYVAELSAQIDEERPRE